jgi:hypothetical protein
MTYRGIDANQTAQGNVIVCSATHIIKSRTWMYVQAVVVGIYCEAVLLPQDNK